MSDPSRGSTNHGRSFLAAHSTSLALLLFCLGCWAFIEIAAVVADGGAFAFERSVLLAMRNPADVSDPLGPAWVEEMMRDFTALGGVGLLALLTLATIGYLSLRGMRKAAAFVFIAVVGGLLLSLSLKAGFARPRPDLVPHGSIVFTKSFPSGHSMLAAVVFLSCGALLASVHQALRIRVYILGWAAMLAVLVGLSRIYLGVHWPSDVVAGWAAGAAWSAVCWLTARWLQEHGRIEVDRGAAPREGQ